MKYELLKRVNEPLTFKGFKGIFLFKALAIAFIASICISIIIIVVSSKTIIALLLITVLIPTVYTLNNYKKKSKLDYYIMYKQAANKKLAVRGTDINYELLRIRN